MGRRFSRFSAVLEDDGLAVDWFTFPDEESAEQFTEDCKDFKWEHQTWHVVEGLQLIGRPVGETLENTEV